MDLTNREEIIALLQKHNLWTKKALGQNFLIDRKALDTIIKTSNLSSDDHVIEIGPGLGVLTNELAKSAKTVQTIELDQTLLPILSETLASHNNIEIIIGDALQFTPPDMPYKVVANIPYNITSPLLNHFLQAKNRPTSMTLLVQKEVAEKICDKEPNMSVLSLQVHLFGTPTLIQKVTANSFHPAPKVDSAIIHIETHTPPNNAIEILELAKQGFTQKRKKLSNTLPNFLEKLKKLNLQDKRPQHLSIKDWQTLLSE